MSSLTHESMTNHHASGFLAQLGETWHIWRQRQIQRRQLAQLTEQERHDVGLSWSDVQFETNKPFWRA